MKYVQNQKQFVIDMLKLSTGIIKNNDGTVDMWQRETRLGMKVPKVPANGTARIGYLQDRMQSILFHKLSFHEDWNKKRFYWCALHNLTQKLNHEGFTCYADFHNGSIKFGTKEEKIHPRRAIMQSMVGTMHFTKQDEITEDIISKYRKKAKAPALA